MAASVNSDRSVRRRSGVARWAARRFGPVVVTIAALISVSWISPRLGGAPVVISQPSLAERTEMPPSSKSAENDVKPTDKPGWVDAAEQPAAPRPHHRRRPALESSHSAQIDGFEVLSADELDAISQAH